MRIVIKELTKKYGYKVAIKDVSCIIEPHIYGLMGANGCGKTTFIRCILNIIHYNKGSILFYKNNEEIKLNNIKVGYLPQTFDVFKELTVYEQLEYYYILKKYDKSHAREEIIRVLSLVNLSEYINKKCSALSGGMVRRVGIAQALLGNPDILIFDEPTVGLDPEERLNFQIIIRSLSLNIPIILSTHIIEDISNLCSHVIFMKDNEIKHIGEIEKIVSCISNKVYSCNIEHLKEIKENIKIRYIDNTMARVISNHELNYSFLKQEKEEIYDLYYYLN